MSAIDGGSNRNRLSRMRIAFVGRRCAATKAPPPGPVLLAIRPWNSRIFSASRSVPRDTLRAVRDRASPAGTRSPGTRPRSSIRSRMASAMMSGRLRRLPGCGSKRRLADRLSSALPHAASSASMRVKARGHMALLAARPLQVRARPHYTCRFGAGNGHRRRSPAAGCRDRAVRSRHLPATSDLRPGAGAEFSSRCV